MNKIRRNELCPCGSGTKYKKCCERKEREERRARLSAASDERQLPETALDATEPDETGQPHADRRSAFREAEYEEAIALCLRTLDEPDLMDAPLAIAMYDRLYGETASRGERERFDELARIFRERFPDLHAEHLDLFNEYLFTNAVLAGRDDEALRLAMELASSAASYLDILTGMIDQLAYYGHCAAVVRLEREIWTRIRDSEGLLVWAIDDFARHAAHFEVIEHLRAGKPASIDDPDLKTRLAELNRADLGPFAALIEGLTGSEDRVWRIEDFSFSTDAGAGTPIEETAGYRNLAQFSGEFARWMRAGEGLSESKAEMLRLQIVQYIVDRDEGRLASVEIGARGSDRARRKRRKKALRKPEHPLLPDKSTLDRFLSQQVFFIEWTPYRIATVLEMLPAWLRFLEKRGLAASGVADRQLKEFQSFKSIVSKQIVRPGADPAFGRIFDTWTS